MLAGILFDLDNTLVDRDGAMVRFLAAEVAARPDLSAADLDALIAADDGGRVSRESFCSWATARYPAWAGDAETLSRRIGDRLPSFIEGDAAVSDLVADLAERYRLGIVTNGGSGTQRDKMRHAGIESGVAQMAVCLVSGEVGREKPDPAIFRAALAALGLTAQETLFVGDDPYRDIAPAAQLGMQTCWIRRGREFPPGVPPPDAVVDEVTDLGCLVDRGELP